MLSFLLFFSFFFFNDTATTEIYTLSLHDALPICIEVSLAEYKEVDLLVVFTEAEYIVKLDRKSTRLNSSHLVISYAVFCLKKKKKTSINIILIVSIPLSERLLNSFNLRNAL